jgi:hypothetical protein
MACSLRQMLLGKWRWMKHVVRRLETRKHKEEITAESLGFKTGGLYNKQRASQVN